MPETTAIAPAIPQTEAARPFRLLRSVLIGPATSERFFHKAAAGPADGILLDLEDSVAPEQKERARETAVAIINELDWGGKTLSVRVNGVETRWNYRDMIALAESCPRLDTITLPMVNGPEDIRFADLLLAQVERATGRANPIGIAGIVETARGIAQVEAIAAASPRLEALSFGAGDYAASLNAPNQVIGEPDPAYAVLGPPNTQGQRQAHIGDQWHFAMARLANGCRAHGVTPLDGVHADFKNLDGCRQAATRALALGYEGKNTIHPSQLPIANEVFSPTPEQQSWARDVLNTLQQAQAQGQGATARGGEMFDLAHIKLAQNILAKTEQIAARQTATAAKK